MAPWIVLGRRAGHRAGRPRRRRQPRVAPATTTPARRASRRRRPGRPARVPGVAAGLRRGRRSLPVAADWPALSCALAGTAPTGHRHRRAVTAGRPSRGRSLAMAVDPRAAARGRGRDGGRRPADSPAVATRRRPAPPPNHRRPGPRAEADAWPSAALVLEQRAVGVTATYPARRADVRDGGGVAHVRLPTFNCLTDRAPEDPVAAGCAATPSRVRRPRPPPSSRVDRDEDGTVRLSGRFPTYAAAQRLGAGGPAGSTSCRVHVAPRGRGARPRAGCRPRACSGWATDGRRRSTGRTSTVLRRELSDARAASRAPARSG